MGQTLTHGIYLPDEGERNCYNGLAGNWQLLDGAVGTVAAHTAALAGKAPAVHTHTKSDITDFPAYGNTAGTICEGNDSRLSDARTPVVHTHTKVDITDLLNSNFIPSANNSYDLGSSSYQWKSVYAQSYYYNGTAWGLDKANIWTTYNTFTGNVRPIRLRGSDDDIYNVQPQSVVESQVGFVDKNNNIMSHIAFQHRPDATETHRLCLRQGRITVNAYYSVNLNNLGDFYPEQNNDINLGTSTNKWKTLNGTNPGALSLPKEEYADVDISAQGLNWDLTGSSDNSYTPNRDGWLEIWAKRTSLPTAYISVGNAYVRQVSEATVFNFACVTCPVRNGQTYTVRVLADECHVRIIKAEGNV